MTPVYHARWGTQPRRLIYRKDLDCQVPAITPTVTPGYILAGELATWTLAQREYGELVAPLHGAAIVAVATAGGAPDDYGLLERDPRRCMPTVRAGHAMGGQG